MGLIESLRALIAPPTRCKSLTNSEHWDLYEVDLHRFLGALPKLFETGCFLGLSGGALTPELAAFLRDNRATLSRDTLSAVPRGFSDAHFVPISGDAIVGLASIAQNLAPPEIALYLVVINAERSLLEWYDLPDDPVALAGDLPEEFAVELAELTGGRHQRSKPGA